MSATQRKAAAAALSLVLLCLYETRPGSWAAFAAATTSSQEVRTGTLAVTVAACADADESWPRQSGADGATGRDACQGSSWEPCASSATARGTSAGSASGSLRPGFESTAAVTIDHLTSYSSHLPASVPLVVGDTGTLPARHLRLDLSTSPASAAQSSVSASVYAGGVLVAQGPLPMLTGADIELLGGTRTLAAGTRIGVLVEMSGGVRGGDPADDQFALTASVTAGG